MKVHVLLPQSEIVAIGLCLELQAFFREATRVDRKYQSASGCKQVLHRV